MEIILELRVLNKMIYKMTFISLSRGSGHDNLISQEVQYDKLLNLKLSSEYVKIHLLN